MKITTEITDLRTFNFWSGAKIFADKLTVQELYDLEEMITDIYPDGMTETELNDLFWFEDELLCEWLGLDINEVYER